MDLNTFQHKLDPGLLLVSKPELGDPRFLMSVSLLCMHDENGSLALILNHPLPLYINIDDFSLSENKESELYFPMLRGGPVGQQQCVFLFTSEHSFSLEEAIPVMPGVYLGTQMETLTSLRQRQPIHNDNIRFYLGYAGWSFFQLDCEMSNGWWFTQPSEPHIPFSPLGNNLWLETLAKIGPEFYEQGLEFIRADL
jgi:putative transcriptional regulator